MRRRIAVAALTAVALGACGVSADDSARRSRDETVPFSLLDRDAPPLIPPTSVASQPVDACFVRDGRLVVVRLQLATPATLLSAVEALTVAPDEPGGLRTALREPSLVGNVQLSGGIARADLRSGISQLGGDDQLLAIAQIVCTLTARPGVGQVAFTLDGAPVDVPRGDGSIVQAPVSRDDYARLFATAA